MPVARPILLGAVLLAIALPGHPLAMLSGIPLSVPSLCLVLLIAGWALALPGATPRAGMLTAAFLVVAGLKLATSWLAPGYGLVGEYRTDDKAGTLRVDRALELRGDEFPVHFFNDVRRFNYYTPTEPKRDLLPFTVIWTGQLVVPQAGQQTLTLEANGPATMRVGNGAPVIIRENGRVREATLTADLPAGLVPITVTYSRPDEAMPWLVLSGAAGLVTPGTTLTTVARESWLRPLGTVLDGLLAGLLALAFLAHVWAAGRTAKETSPPSACSWRSTWSWRSGGNWRTTCTCSGGR